MHDVPVDLLKFRGGFEDGREDSEKIEACIDGFGIRCFLEREREGDKSVRRSKRCSPA